MKPILKPLYHKRRAMKRQNGGTYTVKQWRALCAQYRHACLCCGRHEPDIKLTPDHVVPFCNTCNTSKGARTVDYREAWNERAKS